MKKNYIRPQKNKNLQMVRIGKTAAKLFEKKGYLETSIADIASAARVSKGGVFYYFPTKNDILYFILTNYMDLVLEGLEEELKKLKGSSSRVEFIITRHLELYRNNMDEAKTLLHEAHLLPPSYLKTIKEKQKKYFQIVASELSNCLGSNVPKDRLTVITFCLFGMCNWIYSWYNPKGSISLQELSEIVSGIFSKGIWSDKISHGEKSENPKN